VVFNKDFYGIQINLVVFN